MDQHPPGKLKRRTFLLGMAASLIGASMGPVACLPGAQALAFEPFEPFRFAFVSDIHLTNDVPDSFKQTHESQLFLQELVKELNQANLDFVMFGGDQVESIGKNESNWQLFLEIAQELTMPWAFIAGEADVSGSVSVDKMKIFGPDWKSAGIETSTPYWSHNLSGFPGIHLVGMDTSMANSTVGGVSGRQLEWLKRDLEDNKRLFTIVFCHHPLLPPPPYDGGPPWDDYVIPDGGAVREVIGAFPNVKLVISGHLHATKIQQEKNVWHVSCPSLAVYPCAYRIFTVTPEDITAETHCIQFPALVKKARKDLVMSSLADRYSRSNPSSYLEVVQGEPEDWNAIMPLVAGKSLELYTPKKQKRRPEPEPKKQEDTQPTTEKQPEQAAENNEQPDAKDKSDNVTKKHGLFRGRKNKNSNAPANDAGAAPPANIPDSTAPADPNKFIDELIGPATQPAGTGN